jgi:RecJ-like exonuclease
MRRLKYQRYALLTAVVLWALAMSGCEQKTINEIRADPSRYANKEVSVVGTVTRSYSVLGKGVYEVEDGTGKLWIASEKGVPREGARVAVKGKIRDGYNLVMIESSHKAQ